eukprot:m51a1_g9899 hypothetical protein (300) ;mRNA; f:72875-73864
MYSSLFASSQNIAAGPAPPKTQPSPAVSAAFLCAGPGDIWGLWNRWHAPGASSQTPQPQPLCGPEQPRALSAPAQHFEVFPAAANSSGFPRNFSAETVPQGQSAERAPGPKTSLCHFWYYGRCTRGAACPWAHGVCELKGAPSGRLSGVLPHHSRFKTVVCSFWERGMCKKGANCEFAHGEAELRRPGARRDSAAARGDGDDRRDQRSLSATPDIEQELLDILFSPVAATVEYMAARMGMGEAEALGVLQGLEDRGLVRALAVDGGPGVVWVAGEGARAPQPQSPQCPQNQQQQQQPCR